MADEDASETQRLVERPRSEEDGAAGAPRTPGRKTPRRRWGLNSAINAIGFGRFQLGILLLCGLSETANGIQQLSVSFLLHYLGQLFSLSNGSKALIGTFSGAGMLVGATVWGRVSDVKGRKYAFTGSLVMAGGFGLLASVSPNYGMFLVMRFFLSIGIGGNVPLAFTIFTEFCPKENRGGYLTMLEAFWSSGAVISCLLAWGILPSYDWRYYQLACAMPALLLVFVVIFRMPETPRFCVISGDVVSAQITLERMAEANDRPKLKEYQLRPELGEETFRPNFTDLFNPQFRWTTLPLFLIYFCLSFGCGVFVWLPSLLALKKFEVISMYRSMVILAMSQIPGVMTAAYLVERWGRKKAIRFFFLMGALSVLFFGFSESHAVVVLTSILMEFFLAGCNGSISAYTVEVFPTELRSSAMGACSSLARFSAIINPSLWAMLLDVSDRAAIFSGALVLLIGYFTIYLLPTETSQVDLIDRVKKDD
jgi:putative MFS transporter